MLATRAPVEDQPPVICALHSLTGTDIGAITTALVGASGWSFDRHVSCGGDLVLLITHHRQDTTLVVQRDAAGFHLAVMQGDRLCPDPTCHADRGSLIAALRRLTISGTGYLRHRFRLVEAMVEPIGIEPTTS